MVLGETWLRVKQVVLSVDVCFVVWVTCWALLWLETRLLWLETRPTADVDNQMAYSGAVDVVVCLFGMLWLLWLETRPKADVDSQMAHSGAVDVVVCCVLCWTTCSLMMTARWLRVQQVVLVVRCWLRHFDDSPFHDPSPLSHIPPSSIPTPPTTTAQPPAISHHHASPSPIQ